MCRKVMVVDSCNDKKRGEKTHLKYMWARSYIYDFNKAIDRSKMSNSSAIGVIEIMTKC